VSLDDAVAVIESAMGPFCVYLDMLMKVTDLSLFISFPVVLKNLLKLFHTLNVPKK
jgi:hypothetical protein